MAGKYSDINSLIDGYHKSLVDIDAYMRKIHESFHRGSPMSKISSEHCIVELGQKTQTFLDAWIIISIQCSPAKLKEKLTSAETTVKLGQKGKAKASSVPLAAFNITNTPIPKSKLVQILGDENGQLGCHYEKYFLSYSLLLADSDRYPASAKASQLKRNGFFHFMSLCNALRNHVAHRSDGSAETLNEIVRVNKFIGTPDVFQRKSKVSNDTGNYTDARVPDPTANASTFGDFEETRLGALMFQLDRKIATLKYEHSGA
ncbi:hypothetical protein Csp1_26820 [Corynebacterium provencense]|uniref:Uncharacterized protein n=1 Tax=Corynebacterium provencense TaxID=1737425 RepID=A0A2Z3YPN9_9CORY|nr:hypothetical protein [Corynebacterium provencense]AWT27425.1 hypothetical protein Csp1_26820 [Corynebacterium provencense]